MAKVDLFENIPIVVRFERSQFHVSFIQPIIYYDTGRFM